MQFVCIQLINKTVRIESETVYFDNGHNYLKPSLLL